MKSEGEENPSEDLENSGNESDESLEKFNSNQIKVLVILSFSNFCYGACISLQSPFFPDMVESKGLSPTVIGLITGVHFLSLLIFIPVFGSLVNSSSLKWNHCSGVLTVGGCTVLLGTLKMCPRGIPLIALVSAVFFMMGLGANLLKITSYLLVASHFPGHLDTMYVSIEIFFGLGFIVGPIVGGALIDSEGYLWAYYFFGALSLIDLICAIAVLPSTDAVPYRLFHQFCAWFRNTGPIIYFVTIFTSLFYAGFLFTTLRMELRQVSLSYTYLGLTFVIVPSVFIITFPGWNWIVRVGFNNVLIIFLSCIFSAISMFLIGPAPFLNIEWSLEYVIVSLVLYGLGLGGKLASSSYGAIRETLSLDLTDVTSLHGAVTTLFAVAAVSGIFVGSSISGYVYDTLGFRTGILVPLVLEAILMIIVFVYAFNRNYTRPKRELVTKYGRTPRVEEQPILRHEGRSRPGEQT